MTLSFLALSSYVVDLHISCSCVLPIQPAIKTCNISESIDRYSNDVDDDDDAGGTHRTSSRFASVYGGDG